MASRMAGMRASLSFSHTSGSTSRSAEGASPATASALRQYSGWAVNWSQATTAHFDRSTPSRGSSISAVFNALYINVSIYVMKMRSGLRAKRSLVRNSVLQPSDDSALKAGPAMQTPFPIGI